MNRITNIKQLRQDLLDEYEHAKDDPRRLPIMRDLASNANTVFKGLAVELKYSEMRGEVPNIAFLNTGESKTKQIKD